MTDIEGLRTAMHAAVDGEKASADELIRLVKRRHRRHTIRVACIAVRRPSMSVIAASCRAAFRWQALREPAGRLGRCRAGRDA